MFTLKPKVPLHLTCTIKRHGTKTKQKRTHTTEKMSGHGTNHKTDRQW